MVGEPALGSHKVVREDFIEKVLFKLRPENEREIIR